MPEKEATVTLVYFGALFLANKTPRVLPTNQFRDFAYLMEQIYRESECRSLEAGSSCLTSLLSTCSLLASPTLVNQNLAVATTQQTTSATVA